MTGAEVQHLSSRESQSPGQEHVSFTATLSASCATQNTRQSWSRQFSDSDKVKKRRADGATPLFVDADDMKERVRKNLAKTKYNVKDYYKPTGIWRDIATSHRFEIVTLAVIALNSLWIAIDTDLNKAEILIDAHPAFQVGEHFFCSFFFFEWTVRYFAFQRKRDCLKDGWFVFDSILVLAMVSETWVMTGLTLITGASSGSGAGNTSVLRTARLLRLSRMARMARLLRAMPEIMILVKGMLAASRSVVFTLFLLLLLMYVFAIALTQLLTDTDIGKEKFSSVPDSMYTLWIHGTLLDDINALQKSLVRDSIICTVIFFMFVLLAALTVMNMLIGVLCEVVSAVAATEKEEMLVSYVNMKLHDVVYLIDQDGDMSISKAEFTKILENGEACRCLEDVGVDVIGLIDSADAIFEDVGTADGAKLSFPQFMEAVLRLRGSNTATVKDVVDMRKYIRDGLARTNLEIHQLQAQMHKEMQKTRSALYAQMQMEAVPSHTSVSRARATAQPLNTLLMPFSTGAVEIQKEVDESMHLMASPTGGHVPYKLPPAQDARESVKTPDDILYCNDLASPASVNGNGTKRSSQEEMWSTTRVPSEWSSPQRFELDAMHPARATVLFQDEECENLIIQEDEIDITPRVSKMTPVVPSTSPSTPMTLCGKWVPCQAQKKHLEVIKEGSEAKLSDSGTRKRTCPRVGVHAKPLIATTGPKGDMLSPVGMPMLVGSDAAKPANSSQRSPHRPLVLEGPQPSSSLAPAINTAGSNNHHGVVELDGVTVHLKMEESPHQAPEHLTSTAAVANGKGPL